MRVRLKIHISEFGVWVPLSSRPAMRDQSHRLMVSPSQSLPTPAHYLSYKSHPSQSGTKRMGGTGDPPVAAANFASELANPAVPWNSCGCPAHQALRTVIQ